MKPLKQMNLYLMGAFNEMELQVLVFEIQVTCFYIKSNSLRVHLMKFVRKSNLFDKERYIPLCRKRIRWNEENFNLKTQINPQDYNVQINPQGSNVF